ncbi:MAG: hypothetical protein AVDCRST_MAG54-655, partial [uncultured Actinomycetospora sp.]
AAALRPGGLQLPAPGRLRRPDLPAAGADHAQHPGRRLHRWRERVRRAASPPAVARDGRPPRARRGRRLPGAPPPEAGGAGPPPRPDAPRGVRRAHRGAPRPGRDLPRRPL